MAPCFICQVRAGTNTAKSIIKSDDDGMCPSHLASKLAENGETVPRGAALLHADVANESDVRRGVELARERNW